MPWASRYPCVHAPVSGRARPNLMWMRALRSWRAHRVGLPVILVTIGDQAVYGVADAPPAMPDDVRNNVMRALTGYMTAATVKPLQKGSVDNGALASMFDNSVNARATTSDRGVLVDDGMPKATGRITLTAAPVKLSALVDDRGRVIGVTAALDATTNAKTSKGK